MNRVLIDCSFDLLPELATPEEALRAHAPGFGYAKYLWPKFKVIIIEQISYEGEISVEHVGYHFFKSKRRPVHISFKMLRFIKKNKPLVILIQGLLFPLEIIVLRLMLDKHIILIAQHHGELPCKGVKSVFQRIADRCISAYLFTSLDNAKSWVDQKIIPGYHKCFEVLEASTCFERQDRNQSRQKVGMKGENNFLWVGRLNANKDPVTVLVAFEDYLSICDEAKLYMIYQDESLLSELRTIITTNPELSKAVFLLGKRPHEELPVWYSAADFYVSGSHREGSGFALLEAMACGCIPVVTNIPSFRKITANGKYGFLYEPGDAHGLSHTLHALHQADRDKFSEEILQYFNEELSFQSIADRLCAVCEHMISE